MQAMEPRLARPGKFRWMNIASSTESKRGMLARKQMKVSTFRYCSV